ncbi:ommochrome-binding protein-like [Epargyreus clarus]|uniref:ommochrome-binding protein-like n=1 Tax=Epargyreus clarus TaxID=520877 RepID=UPI003C307D04
MMTIKFCLILVLIKSSYTNSMTEKTCDRIQIDNQWYHKQILWMDNGRPYHLNVHKQTNTLFFSYSVPATYSDIDFQLVTLNLETKEYLNIAGIRGGCATAVDQGNDEVYLGGSDGIYKYNMATKLADYYKEKDKNIWSLFYRRNLFYVSYPDQKLYMEVDGKFALVKEFQNFEVDQFFTTNDGEIYYGNNTGLYRYNKNKLRSEVINDLITIRQITEDNNGTIYTCTNFGVFTIRNGIYKKVLDMRNVYGLSFDRDNNFILSDDRRVMKLLKSNVSCVDTDHW